MTSFDFIDVVQQLTWTGIAFGIMGYFIDRERNRRRENMAMLERMTPEQLAEIRRVDAQIEAERKRHSAGNLWFLRLGMAIIGAGCGLITGLQCFSRELERTMHSNLAQAVIFKIIATTVIGIGLFIFLEFLIELRLRRMEQK